MYIGKKVEMEMYKQLKIKLFNILMYKGENKMNEYEVFIEDINPCGGSQYAKKQMIEVEAESPEEYVKEHGRFPIIDVVKNKNGDTVITTGDGSGNFVKYIFSE